VEDTHQEGRNVHYAEIRGWRVARREQGVFVSEGLNLLYRTGIMKKEKRSCKAPYASNTSLPGKYAMVDWTRAEGNRNAGSKKRTRNPRNHKHHHILLFTASSLNLTSFSGFVVGFHSSNKRSNSLTSSCISFFTASSSRIPRIAHGR